jgi:hypothetical protein
MRRLAMLLAFLFFGVSLVSATGPAYALDKNCSDFDTQAQAQAWHNDHPEDGLDSDDDGVACETLPCPCATGGGGGGGGGGTPPPAKKFHNLTAQKGKVDVKPVAYGKVTTYKGERIRIMRRVEGSGFKVFKTVVTKKATGKFNVSISTPKGKTSCFRVTVPATKKYKLTTKAVGCIG